MPGPEKNFGTLDGITHLYQAPAPVIIPSIRINSLTYLWRLTYVFFKFGLINQAGTAQKIGISIPKLSTLVVPNVSSARLTLITFPPIYKTRTDRARPLKGQLWPRTR